MEISTSATAIPLRKSYGNLKAIPAPKKLLLKKLAVALSDETRFIDFEDIVYCKADNNYTTVFTKCGKSYLCCKTLKDIEAKLPADNFIRIHHSYLVNLQSITALKKQSCELEIDNRLLLPVSRTQKTALYELLGL
ncbi:MAG: LytTR family DNA-binding domain-containing protein [Bacteroidota bacterium]